ncbi:MAG: ABC transporter permease [Gammaproteobacteria bacterium]|nr:ABC transporter permease [Gammaproteobacteria bacterium]
MPNFASIKAIGWRLACATVAILAVSLAVFCLIHLIPGDPIDAMLGEHATSTDRAALAHALGLDASLPTQLVRYYRGLLQFDLGRSVYTQQPIAAMLLERAPFTAVLAMSAVGLALLISIPLGILSALGPRSGWDRATLVLAVIGGAVPSFVIGPVLIVVFAVWLGWVPVSGAESARGLVLPAVTLSLGLSAILVRQLRSALRGVLGADYIRTATALGATPFELMRHALPNAALPVLSVAGTQLGVLMGGAVITETVFGWPGLGALTIEAIQGRDYPVVQACVLYISLAYVLINTLLDLVYAWCDPRISWR